jgi:hypothetical protein
VLSFLAFDLQRPAWANGAIRGLTASALGLFFLVSIRNLPTTRKTRLGPVAVLAAFVAYGVLGIDLLLVLAGVGAVSLLLNLPPKYQKEDHQ